MLLGIVPLIHGSHDVLHKSSSTHIAGRLHQAVAETLSYAAQGMNMEIVRPSHLSHHRSGRADGGFMPDLHWSARHLYGYVVYYANLLLLPALFHQFAGYARLFVGPHRLSPDFPESMPQKITPAYIRNQAAVTVFVVYALVVGGLIRTAVYETVLCLVWSLGQNVAHYGLRAPDPTTERVCARTYLLPWPLSWLTFGSTSHFLHHADMRVPGAQLYREDHIKAAENAYGITVRRYYGVWPYLRDVAKQFRGPLRGSDLSTEWIASARTDSGERGESLVEPADANA
jgi:fatty acid desaturase